MGEPALPSVRPVLVFSSCLLDMNTSEGMRDSLTGNFCLPYWQKLHDHLTVCERMLHLALISFTRDNPKYEHAGVGWASVQIFLFLKTFGAGYSGGTRSQHSSLGNFNTSGYNHLLICGKTNFGSSPNSSCFVLSTCRWAYPSRTGQSSNDHDDLFLTSQHPTGRDDLGGFCLAWREWIVAILSSPEALIVFAVLLLYYLVVVSIWSCLQKMDVIFYQLT